ncbi:MAG: polysaccharide biosynthesis/export family protein [Thermoanaerobaculia bacterium]
MRRERSRTTVAWAALSLALACAGPRPPPAEFEARPKEGVYVIGVADRLRIDVWQNDKLQLQDVPVRPDGKITVPLLDDVQAAGLTTDELKQVLTQELSEYVQNPTVTVVVLAAVSKRAFVLGEVRSSGPISLSVETRVLDAITSAGGFTPFAQKSRIRVLRYVEGRELEYRFDYDSYVSGDAPGTNLVLQPGDTVLVP